jgi:Hemerythrin HHE cation binding domain
MTDIIELILADHQRIRRLLGALDDAARYGEGPGASKALAQVWRRLAGLLELHAEAEEEICYLALFGAGQDATAQMQDAIDDHDDIREAVREARLHAAGSAIWWRAVNAALRASRDHIAREESGALAAFGRRAAPALRDELGRQWTAFIAARTRDAPPEHAHLRPQSLTSPATREGSARCNVSQKPAAGPGSEHNDQAMAPVMPMPANPAPNDAEDMTAGRTRAPSALLP